MIFVTVGTHEQQFNRLIEEVDRLKGENLIKEDVFIQTGYSTYIPKFCEYKNLISYDEMEEYMQKASCVITHGGPATFMKSLSLGKNTIVVPRLEKYGEHINNHQLEFLEVMKKVYGISYIKNIEDLEKTINNIESENIIYKSNNSKFCEKLIKIL